MLNAYVDQFPADRLPLQVKEVEIAPRRPERPKRNRRPGMRAQCYGIRTMVHVPRPVFASGRPKPNVERKSSLERAIEQDILTPHPVISVPKKVVLAHLCLKNRPRVLH